MRRISADEFRAAFPAFDRSPGKLVSDILAVARLHAFPKDARIYSEGDVCSAIAFLLSGELRVYKAGESGREITLYEITAGETCILNASCILSGMSYPANAVSLAEGEMLLIPASDFRGLMDHHEEMREFVFTVLSRRLSAVMSLIEEIAFGKMDERLASYLREKAEGGMLQATHQKIADDLGTSREVVSRILKDFERKGMVSLSRNLISLLSR
ncbi:MAG: Crp/Fnr family transcriptional regulator [Nitrospiraceae bacterium]|nr:Crp/Fnr family transcriptional regulator [Nitrospiraceae bacterium]